MPTALITGASGGIGAAFARELAQRQTNLVLVSRSAEKLRQLAQELQQKYGTNVEVIVQDLIAPEATTKVFETVTQKNISVDLLINNAGFGDYGPFSQSDRTKQLQIVQLNCLALVDMTHLFLPQMLERRSGSIINVSSIAGFQPLPYLSVYSATKAFVLHFSEALWAENHDKGVKFLACCPGPTESNFFETAGFARYASGSSDRQKVDTAEDVVRETMEALARDECTVVTGQWQNKITVNLSRLTPRKTLVQLVEPQFRPKAK